VDWNCEPRVTHLQQVCKIYAETMLELTRQGKKGILQSFMSTVTQPFSICLQSLTINLVKSLCQWHISLENQDRSRLKREHRLIGTSWPLMAHREIKMNLLLSAINNSSRKTGRPTDTKKPHSSLGHTKVKFCQENNSLELCTTSEQDSSSSRFKHATRSADEKLNLYSYVLYFHLL
jgi:hypothetical protein